MGSGLNIEFRNDGYNRTTFRNSKVYDTVMRARILADVGMLLLK